MDRVGIVNRKIRTCYNVWVRGGILIFLFNMLISRGRGNTGIIGGWYIIIHGNWIKHINVLIWILLIDASKNTKP